MLQIVHYLLRLLPAELAHDLGMIGLKILQRIVFIVAPRAQPIGAPSLVIHADLKWKLPHRLGLAAGFDKQAEVFPILGRFGFGFIEVGSVTPKAQSGNPKPRMWRIDSETLLNHMGFNSVGLERFHHNMKKYRRYTQVPILANLGKNKGTENDDACRDYAVSFRVLENVVDGFVVNLSSPNTPGLVSLQDCRFLDQLLPIIPKHKPCWIKLSYDLDEASLVGLLERVRIERQLTGVVLSNTSRTLGNAYREIGGLSGARLFEKNRERVALAREKLGAEKLIIGVGGVMSANDAKDLRQAGADLIEIYTAFVLKGPRIIREISAAVRD